MSAPPLAVPRDLRPDVFDIERRLLAACLWDAAALDDAAAVVSADDFAATAHRAVWSAAVALRAEGKPSAAAAVWQEMIDRRTVGQLETENVGGWFAELVDLERSGYPARYYAERVAEFAKLRRLRHVLGVQLANATDPRGPADEVAAQAEQAVFEASAGVGLVDAVPDAAATVRKVLTGLDDRAAGGPVGVPTGIGPLDELVGGLKPGQLVVLGARPSVGKTAMAIGVAVHAGASGTPPYFLSLEMSEQEVGERVLSLLSGVPLKRFEKPKEFTAAEVDMITAASGQFGRLRINIHDPAEMTATRLAAVARRQVRKRNVGLVIVDYLGLLTPENPKDNRTQQVGLMARRLKQLARQLRVPVLCLAQLNREVEGRPDGRPRLADLRESGEVEQHADQVWLLHRRPGQADDWQRWDIDLIVAKNRNGPVGVVPLAYHRPSLRFEPRPIPI